MINHNIQKNISAYLLTVNFSVFQGTLEQFDYPKKGKNIPPSKHDAPPKEVPEQKEQESGEDQASYYDENGQVQDGVARGMRQDYGNEDGQYGDEQEDYGDEQDEMQQDMQQEYDQEEYGGEQDDQGEPVYGDEDGQDQY